VVLHLRSAGMSMATLQDLRELVGRLRKAGKRVVAWAPSYGTGAYYLACACDEILLMPTGSVRALGFSSTSLFLADGLARLGLGADFVQVSPYKSAADPLTKSSMSDELREQISWLLESQHEELLTAIAESRLLDSAGAKELIDCSPYGDDVAVEKRAVDLVVGQVARQVAADKRAAAVVLYVNSRGGSSTASEAMRHALAVVGQRKPIVVVMGPVAASGGYWVSMPGSWIVARPGTITGSIGVLSGKIITGSMWEKLLFSRETIARGDRVLLESDERPFTDEERSIVRADITRIYN